MDELFARLKSFLPVCQSKVKGAFYCVWVSFEAVGISNAAGKCHVVWKQQPSRAGQSLRALVLLQSNHYLNTSLSHTYSLSLSFLVSLPLCAWPRGACSPVIAPVRSYPCNQIEFYYICLPGAQHSTAKTCFVLFNLFRWGRKPTVTLSFASDAIGLPRGPNVRLHHAVLVILPKYSSLGISGCRRKFTVSHTWPLVGHCLRPWEVVKIKLIVNS